MDLDEVISAEADDFLCEASNVGIELSEHVKDSLNLRLQVSVPLFYSSPAVIRKAIKEGEATRGGSRYRFGMEWRSISSTLTKAICNKNSTHYSTSARYSIKDQFKGKVREAVLKQIDKIKDTSNLLEHVMVLEYAGLSRKNTSRYRVSVETAGYLLRYFYGVLKEMGLTEGLMSANCLLLVVSRNHDLPLNTVRFSVYTESEKKL